MATEARQAYELPRIRFRAAAASVTPLSAELAALFVRLAAVTMLAPELSASELRPFVEALEARRRTCEAPGCGKAILQRGNYRGRPHAFCSDDCRNAFHRERRAEKVRLNIDAEVARPHS